MNYVNLMRPIVQKAGDLVMFNFRQNITITYKKDKSIVTNVDLLCEEFLKTELLAALPGSGFIAEESKQSNVHKFTWVIDPIDGTKNFVRGIPYFCINVALMQEQEIIAAVTYQPVLDEWFYAQKGCGAFLNSTRLQLQQSWKSAGALIVVSDYLLRKVDDLNQIKQVCKSIEQGVRFRVNGAVALDLAYAASGMFDVVIFQNLACWDMVAGILLIQEAGGMVCEHDGAPITWHSKSLIAGDEQLCKLVMSVLK
ncbi:hypothetical protein A3J41_02245 [candidate division TM6 bacterium RIFCSPHIGHO2_12_FULL_38_8]|nr:MAG: hypothetical protein A3J41_02245 [candidate division TM6 bacterium RIFCSPHIGHO2_12_FULL_38_8]